MSSRSQSVRANASDAARIAKKKQNSNHYQDNTLAGIYPTVPLVETVSIADALEAQRQKDEADLLQHLNGSNFVDMVRDYDGTSAGWNPDVVQGMKFQSPAPTENNPNAKRTTWMYLGVADGQDTGLVYHPVDKVNNRVVKDEEGNPALAEAHGRWHLERAEREECQIPRSRYNCTVEIDGEMKPIETSIVFGLKSEEPYAFMQDIDKTTMDPTERVPVVVDMEHWVEDAQVVQMGEKFFAHRNLLGTLRLETLDGKPGPAWPICEVEPDKIERKREAYAKQVAEWRAMSVEERKQARRNRSAKVPYGAGQESYLIKAENAHRSNFLVEVKKDDAGIWRPVSS
jgi:hypothetical protein